MQTPMVQLFVGQCVEQLVSQCADLRYLHKAQIRRKRTIVGQTISVPVRGPNSLPFVPSDILSPVRCRCDKKHRLQGGGIWHCLTLVELEIVLICTIQLRIACSLDKYHWLRMCQQYSHRASRCQLLLALSALFVNNNETQYHVEKKYEEEWKRLLF